MTLIIETLGGRYPLVSVACGVGDGPTLSRLRLPQRESLNGFR